MTRLEPAYIDLYVSFGTSDGGATVRGRVLEGRRVEAPGPRRRDRLRATWRLFETDEIPDVRVEVALEAPGGSSLDTDATTDEEGFFRARFPGPLAAGVHTARATLSAPRFVAEPITAPVLVHAAAPGLGIVSDIDDTVLRTGVTDKLEMLRRVIFSGPEDLETFSGAPELYQRLVAAGMPLFFVSGSPWNLEPRLRAFFAARAFPAAPLMLKNLGIGSDADPLLDQIEYKTKNILEVMGVMATRRFILIGDSGEKDPEIYAGIAREHPGRVARIYIRRVGAPDDALAGRCPGAVIFDDYRDVLDDVQAQGFLPAPAAAR